MVGILGFDLVYGVVDEGGVVGELEFFVDVVVVDVDCFCIEIELCGNVVCVFVVVDELENFEFLVC